MLEANASHVRAPQLYRRLCRLFGEVRISGEGEPMVGRIVRDPILGRTSYDIESFGESYLVCCPYCGDSRFRLTIPHMYGQADPANPQFPLRLGRCFNQEDCLKDPLKRQDLTRKLSLSGRFSALAFARPEEMESANMGVAAPPGDVVSVSLLPDSHPAVRYLLIDRQFDMDLLVRYGVSYCVRAYPQYRKANERIIIPVVFNGVVVGWQARAVPSIEGDSPWAKYWTKPGMPKRRLLYNYDVAKVSPCGALMEGVTDVWRQPRYAVASFGCSVSPMQRQLIATAWRGKPFAVVYDPEESEIIAETVSRLVQLGVLAFPTLLTPGSDPGSMDPVMLDSVIAGAARQHGVAWPERYLAG